MKIDALNDLQYFTRLKVKRVHSAMHLMTLWGEIGLVVVEFFAVLPF